MLCPRIPTATDKLREGAGQEDGKHEEWAQIGAAQRVAEIQAELAHIRKAFPAIGARLRAGRRVESGSGGGTVRPEEGKRKRRRRPPMSAAQRKAVGIRMKKYWAARRKVIR